MMIRALGLVAPLLMITACGGAEEPQPETAAPAPAGASASAWSAYQGGEVASPAGSFAPDIQATGSFLPARSATTAFTYDPAVVPPGATAKVAVSTNSSGTSVRLTTAGMIPSRAYGAHLHTQPCTAVPDQAGPHYQNQHDPAASASPPSVDPAYANPRNEVWLDFTADATGAGTAQSGTAWTFPPGQEARSLIIHAQQTNTAPGKAGTAGPRVACLTLPAR